MSAMSAFIPSLHVPGRTTFTRPLTQQKTIHRRPCTPTTRRAGSTPSKARNTLKAVATPLPQSSIDQLVDTLLLFIQGTDRGTEATNSEREAIRSIIDQLCAVTSGRSLLTHPRLFDQYRVVYSYPFRNVNSQPVGGLLRTRLGKALFRTRGLFEHYIAPNIVVNLLCFRFLGIFKGAVALRGRIKFAQRGSSSPNDVVFAFEQPRLSVCRAVFQYGPKPNIGTTLKYVDDRIRINVSKRGSVFVFARLDSDVSVPEAQEWSNVFAAKPLPTLMLPLFALGSFAGSLLLPMAFRLAALAVAVCTTFLLRSGGADVEPSNIKNGKYLRT